MEYVAEPDATINGVSRILCGRDLNPRETAAADLSSALYLYCLGR